MKSHTNNTKLQIFFIHSIFILLTFLAVFSVNVTVAVEVVPTTSGGNLPVTALNSLMETAVDPPMKTALNSLMNKTAVESPMKTAVESPMKTAVESPMKTAVDPPMELNLFNNNIYITNNGSNIVINNATNTSVGEVPFESGFNPSEIPDTRIDSAIDGNSENTIVEASIDTIIDSAEDGDGEEIMNGDSTTSNDIEFTFSGNATIVEDEDIKERGFVCELDEEPVDDCGEPVTDMNPFNGTEEFNNLDPGEHTFNVTAFIDLNDEGPRIFDLIPAIINWTINDDDDDNDNGPSGGGDGGNDNDNGPSGGGGGGNDNDNGPSGSGDGGNEIINEADCPPFPLPNDTDCLPDSIPNGNGTDGPPFPLPTGTKEIDDGPPFKPPSVTLSNKPWLILGTLS